YLPFYECGAIARSRTPGLSIRSTYFDFDVVHPPGEWAGLNGSHGSGAHLSVLSPIGLELMFDGTAPAGTLCQGGSAANIGGDGIGYIPRIIGSINVYVVAPNSSPPPTWFTVTSDTASVIGNRLLLRHPLLDGQPLNRIFVTHTRTSGSGAGAA